MITIDDGVWPSLSVIGGGSSANGDIAIKLRDVIKAMTTSAGSGEGGGALAWIGGRAQNGGSSMLGIGSWPTMLCADRSS
jgi:hypothetical protein